MDTLYKRTKTGAIQYWKVEVVPNNNEVDIIKESGKLNGTPVRHVDTITSGKNVGKANETTPFEQANLQAASDWRKKKDDGYKSLDDLQVTAFEGDLESTLDRVLPKFNTDASGNIKPMLAKSVNWKKVKYPCLVQPKLDGIRCLMKVTKFPAKISFISRKGKEFTTLGHIEETIKNFLYYSPSDDFILDGEIYSDELSFQNMCKALKKLSPGSAMLKLRVYDMVLDEPQEDRLNALSELVSAINSPEIEMVSTDLAMSTKEVTRLHNKFVQENGYEGAIIRTIGGKYEQGFRSSHLLKVKVFDEDEFKWVGWEFGARGNRDLLAICKTKTGQIFKPTMFGTIAEKEELYAKTPTKGAKMIVKYFGFTDDGIPRHPNGKGFRDYE